MVKNRRNLIAYDDSLHPVPSLALDTKIIILSMAWSPKFQTLYIAGNFGWIRALEIHAHTSISGTAAEWEGKWTQHHQSQWMQLLLCDDTKEVVFGASGTDIFIFSMRDGSLLQQFNTGHTMAISAIDYSKVHMMLFTASADGTVKTWQLFEKSALNTQTIEQVKLGPIRLGTDNNTIFTISHERILRRYNMMTGNLIGLFNLEPAVPMDMKNVEVPVTQYVAYMPFEKDKKQWVFTCEGTKITQFQACYAPRELTICSDAVISIKVSKQGLLYALSKNNIIHEISPNSHESKVFDLDTLPVANTGKPHTISVAVTEMVLCDNLIYVSFVNGEIKVFNTETQTLYEMNEPDLGTSIVSMLPQKNVMTIRHSYCKMTDHVESLLFSSSGNGGIVINCPVCYDNIGSWKLSKTGLLHMERVPNKPYIIGIEEGVVHVYKVDEENFKEVSTHKLDEFEVAQTFLFVTDTLLVVCLDTGKGKVYEFVDNEKGKPKIVLQHIMKLHDSNFTNAIAVRDILQFEGAKEVIEKEDINGFIVSLGANDTLTIADCITGIVQYQIDTPKHVSAHYVAITFSKGAIKLVLGVDQNIRVLGWPDFVRIMPSPPETPKEEPETPAPQPEEEEEEEDDIMMSMSFFNQTTNQILRTSSFFSTSSSTDDLLANDSLTMISNNIQYPPLVYPPIPQGGRKKMDLVFENGFPKLVTEGEEQPPQVQFTQSFTLNDVLNSQRSETDAVMEKNRKIIEHLIETDPKMAAAFRTKKVKKVKTVEVDDVDDEFFYNFFLTLNVKAIPKEYFQQLHDERVREGKEKRNKIFSAYSSASGSRTTTARTHTSQSESPVYVPHDIQPIKPIRKLGNRKARERKKPQRMFIIELEDGTTIQTNELTAELLAQYQPDDVDTSNLTDEQRKELSKYHTILDRSDSDDDFDPKKQAGSIFSQALETLKRQNQQRKELLYKEEKRITLPIQTLTSDGIAIGAYRTRHFQRLQKEYIENLVHHADTNNPKSQLNESQFLHWEGVAFRTMKRRPHVKKISVSVNQEEIEEEEEEEEEEETFDEIRRRREIMENMFNNRRRYGNRQGRRINNAHSGRDSGIEDDTYGAVPFDPSRFVSIGNPEEHVPEKEKEEGEGGDTVQLIKNDRQSAIKNNFEDKTPPDEGMTQFNLFDPNNQHAKQIIDESPSIQNIATVFSDNTSDNPLQDILDKTNLDDSYSFDALLKKYQPSEGFPDYFKKASDPTDLDFSVPTSNPLSNSIFSSSKAPGLVPYTVGGLPRSEIPVGGYSKRPASPPGMITLQTLNAEMNERHIFLPVISESSFDESLLGSISEDEENEPPHASEAEKEDSPPISLSDIPRSYPKKQPLKRVFSRQQMNVQDILTRNDFSELRNLLDDAGLLDENTLVDQPKWQPTVNFLSYHQKQMSQNSSSATIQQFSSKDSFKRSSRSAAMSAATSATNSLSSVSNLTTSMSEKDIIQSQRETLESVMQTPEKNSDTQSDISDIPESPHLDKEPQSSNTMESIIEEPKKEEEEEKSDVSSLKPEINVIEDDSDDNMTEPNTDGIPNTVSDGRMKPNTPATPDNISGVVNNEETGDVTMDKAVDETQQGTDNNYNNDNNVTADRPGTMQSGEKVSMGTNDSEKVTQNTDGTVTGTAISARDGSVSESVPSGDVTDKQSVVSAAKSVSSAAQSVESEAKSGEVSSVKDGESVTETIKSGETKGTTESGEPKEEKANEEEEMYVYEEEEIIEEEEEEQAEYEYNEEGEKVPVEKSKASRQSNRKSSVKGDDAKDGDLPSFKLDSDDDLDLALNKTPVKSTRTSSVKTGRSTQRSSRKDKESESKDETDGQSGEPSKASKENGEEEDYSYSYSDYSYSYSDDEKKSESKEKGTESTEQKTGTGETVTVTGETGAATGEQGASTQQTAEGTIPTDGQTAQTATSTTKDQEKEKRHHKSRHHKRSKDGKSGEASEKGDGQHRRRRHHSKKDDGTKTTRSKKTGPLSARSAKSVSQKSQDSQQVPNQTKSAPDGQQPAEAPQKPVIQAKTRKIRDSKIGQAKRERLRKEKEKDKDKASVKGKSARQNSEATSSRAPDVEETTEEQPAVEAEEVPEVSGPTKGNTKPVKLKRTIGRRAAEPRDGADANDEGDGEEEIPEEKAKTPVKVVRRRVKKVIKTAPKPPQPQLPQGPTKQELQRREEEELLAKLRANTTDLEVNASIQTVSKKHTGPSLQKLFHKEKEEEETVSLTTKINLDLNNLKSFDVMKKMEEEKEHEQEEQDEDEFELKGLCIHQYWSSENLLTKPLRERDSFKMLGKTEQKLAPVIFMSYDAPSLWDKRIGKLRRNSVI